MFVKVTGADGQSEILIDSDEIIYMVESEESNGGTSLWLKVTGPSKSLQVRESVPEIVRGNPDGFVIGTLGSESRQVAIPRNEIALATKVTRDNIEGVAIWLKSTGEGKSLHINIELDKI